MEVYRWEDRKFGKLEPLRFGAERDFEDLLEKTQLWSWVNRSASSADNPRSVGQNRKLTYWHWIGRAIALL